MEFGPIISVADCEIRAPRIDPRAHSPSLPPSQAAHTNKCRRHTSQLQGQLHTPAWTWVEKRIVRAVRAWNSSARHPTMLRTPRGNNDNGCSTHRDVHRSPCATQTPTCEGHWGHTTSNSNSRASGSPHNRAAKSKRAATRKHITLHLDSIRASQPCPCHYHTSRKEEVAFPCAHYSKSHMKKL